ncbi:MAG: hypothetical protein IJU12_12915 [Clostridia bacterium]|nr:hypothetical protein [Clostridia bacterium]
MRTDSIVYRKLVARIALLGLTRREVADQLGVSYGTLHNKLCAITPFTLNEAIQIKAMLAMPGTLEEVFERYDQKRPN